MTLLFQNGFDTDYETLSVATVFNCYSLAIENEVNV